MEVAEQLKEVQNSDLLSQNTNQNIPEKEELRFKNPIEEHGSLPNDNHQSEQPDQQQQQLQQPLTAVEKWKKRIGEILENSFYMSFMGLLTMWTLYQGDLQAATTNKDADLSFQVIISICFFLFSLEIVLQCFYKEGYLNIPKWDIEQNEGFLEKWERRGHIGSFYFWMDIVATFTLVMDMNWMLDASTQQAFNGGGSQSAQGGKAARLGARVGRVIRLVRMVRLARIGKLYKYALAVLTNSEIQQEKDETEQSKVGAEMADVTNRRVIVLILLMLVIIPLLNQNDPDVSLSLGVQLVHSLAVLNATDPETYYSGLLLALDVTITKLPVIAVIFNDNHHYFYDAHRVDSLRDSEKLEYYYSSNGTSTKIIYDQKNLSVTSAQFSMYTTSFVIVLLLGGIYAFSVDVQTLVIQPIEKLVALVKKIAENPLSVEYKMLGTDDGFVDGMETTVLLTTITKIGGLMRVGFGEAGAAIIARNLKESAGGKLNLLGAGQTIYSIFGFCDVRQFTDTTECLQEEVMLFVNRIAHILHSIVVQCAGAANKNIGDAFLLTWKISNKATKEQKALIADQALLTFCKALIELSRHQEFICNFSVAATGRLFKRFPDYKVRIGSGLHVGWAIEGAIGSNRKIDATYISPHVSATEFLESSTKEYGVSLLLSEPFYRLLSPAAQKYIRQVDRIKRSTEEPPMGLYTYDSDLNIDWNDPFRHRRKSEVKSKLAAAARRASLLSNEDKDAIKHAPMGALANLAPIRESSVKDSESQSTTSNARTNPVKEIRRQSKDGSNLSDHGKNHPPALPYNRGRRKSTLPGLGPGGYNPVPLKEVDEENPELAEEEAAERLKRAKEAPTIIITPYTERIWVEDQDLVDVRHLISDSFRVIWAEGMDAFIIGDWARAKDKFSECYRLTKKKDGPSKRILDIIESHHDAAPEDWKGYMDLSEGGGGH